MGRAYRNRYGTTTKDKPLPHSQHPGFITFASMLTADQLLDAARTYGTPLYVYDEKQIVGQYQRLKTTFPASGTRFFYACKALSNINILRLLQQQGAGLDTVSLNEVRLGILAGFDPGSILYTPNNVAFSELEEAVQHGVHITIDNISILEQFGNRFGADYPILVRLNPHIMAGGNLKISTGHIDSKFGISIHQLRHVLRIVKTTGLRVEGLHMHTGSEIKDIEVFIEALEVLLDCAHHFPHLKYLDLGSGFKVPYAIDEKATDLHQLAKRLQETMASFQKETNLNPEIWFEPGKFIVSQSGYFVTKVNVVKQTPATVFAGIDTGFNHLIRPMFYDAYHRIENLSNPAGTERIYTVVGNLCETDTFCWDRVLPEIREGDYLVFHNAGAYGFEMASSFNSRCRPAEILMRDNQAYMIRRRETLDDLLALQIDLSLPSHSVL